MATHSSIPRKQQISVDAAEAQDVVRYEMFRRLSADIRDAQARAAAAWRLECSLRLGRAA